MKKAAKSGKADVCNDEANVQNDNKILKRPVACDDDEKVALAKIHDAGFSDFSIRAVPMTRCPRCNNECTIEERRLTKKTGRYWICRPCISRYTQLRSIDAEWPPASFKLLSKEDQQKLYDQVRTTSNKNILKLNVDEYLNISKVDRKVNEVGGEYLPLSVLRKRGFSRKSLKKIKRDCKDFKEHLWLGKCYRIEIEGASTVSFDERRRVQSTRVGEDDPAAKTVVAKATPKTKDEKEAEKQLQKDVKEEVRAATAKATQEARILSSQRKIATKLIPRVTKASFNLGNLLASKVLKSLDKHVIAQYRNKHAEIQDLKKILVNATSSKDDLEIDGEASKKLISRIEDDTNK